MEQGPEPSSQTPPERKYDRSGFYPEDGKAFRVWALLGWLLGVVVLLAGASALLNFMLLE